jgi:hypothetical protein
MHIITRRLNETTPARRIPAILTFDNVDDQARVLERVEVHHVPQRAVRQRGTKDGDVVLPENRSATLS